MISWDRIDHGAIIPKNLENDVQERLPAQYTLPFRSIILQNIMATRVLISVAIIAGAIMAVESILPY